MNKITSFQVVDHGIEHAQYFQGCGVAFTEYDECVTGCGDNFAEALDDALESIAQSDAAVDDYLLGRIHTELTGHPSSEYAGKWPESDSVSDFKRNSDDCYYYVSIRYSIEPSEVAK